MKQNSKLTKAVKEVTGKSTSEAEVMVEAVLSSIKNLAKEDGKLTIQGYGTFSVVQKPARVARNPMTGAPVNVPAKEAFTFKASK